MGDRLAVSIIGVLSFAIVFVVGALLLGHQPGGPWRAEVAALPALNAALNATSAALLAIGWTAIRRRRIGLHRACMLAACGVSTPSGVVFHVSLCRRLASVRDRVRGSTSDSRLAHRAAARCAFRAQTAYRAPRGLRRTALARRRALVALRLGTGVIVFFSSITSLSDHLRCERHAAR